MTVRETSPATGHRLVQLEAVRGIASLVVLAHHFCYAFIPSASLPYPRGLGGTPLFWCINGTAAVLLFFLLSGFVLTRRYFDRGVVVGELVVAAAKRLPRLFVPVALSILLGWVVLRSGLAWHAEAARLTGSPWLATYANAKFPPGGDRPSLVYAVVQSATIFLGRHFASWTGTNRGMLNSSLWTMGPEFFGSLLCFASVWALRAFGRNWLVGAIASAVAVAFFILLMKKLCVPFLLGVLLARFFRYERLALPKWLAASLLIAGLALCSSTYFTLNEAGALAIIATMLACPPLAGAMSRRFGVLLGRYSFPIYLVNAAVLCSVSSAAYVGLARTGLPTAALIAVAAIVTLGATLLVATPFAMLEAWWVPTLGRTATWLRERAIAGQRRARAVRARP